MKARPRKRKLVIEITDVLELPRFERRSRGIHSGLGVFEFVSILLAINETNTRALKMTDEALAKRIMDEFPDRPSAKSMREGRMGMWVWRKLYNHGKLTQGIKPKPRSRRYNQFGDVINKFGRVLMRGKSFGKGLGIPYTAGFVNGEKYLNGGYFDEVNPTPTQTARTQLKGNHAGQNMEEGRTESSQGILHAAEPVVRE